MDRARALGGAPYPPGPRRAAPGDEHAHVRFQVRTLHDARAVAQLIASQCRRPEQVHRGLSELLVNAIEHGHLGIANEEKAALRASGHWESALERMLALPEHAAKTVEVRLERHSGETHIWIRDQGPGFDPARQGLAGQGIAFARMVSFDWLEYVGRGNEVHAVISDDATPAGSPRPRTRSE